MTKQTFKRGEIYWVNIEQEFAQDQKQPPKGAETNKNRPGVIISNNKQNQFSGAVIVALISSQVDKVYFFEVVIELVGRASKILTDQIYTVDKSRCQRKIGVLNAKQLEQLAEGIHTVLELNC